MKHIHSAGQFTKESLEELFILADKIKRSPKDYYDLLKGKVVATIFYEPSTRTRLSFSSAIVRLGAGLISTENANENSSAMKGETLEDTIRIVEGYADAIVLRHPDDDSIDRAMKVASVPLINAGSGGSEHPTQGLLDVYTIQEYKGKLDHLKIAILGDLKYGRTTHSLLKLLSLFDGLEVHALSAQELELPKEYEDLFFHKNIKYVKHHTLETLPRDVDVIYHTRIQKERLRNEGIKESEALFIINQEILNTFSQDTLLMHPLPRIEEILPDLDADSRAVFFKQAHNGVYIRMALLADVLATDKPCFAK